MEQLFQNYRDDERRIGEEYLSSLQDLNCNSKPLINMLTMLAEENINYAHIIVKVVEYYISQVAPEFKLPILYLIDSIVKNVKSSYVQLFGQCIVNIFLHAFESVQHSQSQVLEKVRERMYALRQTWNEVFPPSKMYALDVKVKRLDNNWPITAKQPTNKIHVNPAIHVNPDFLKPGLVPGMPGNPTITSDMEEILQAKTRELLELKKRKLELELEQTKKHLEEQERQLTQTTDAMVGAPIIMPAPTPAAICPPITDPGIAVHNQRAPGVMGNVGPVMHNMPVAPQLFANKPKVHPVNPALLNSVRQRDPRLARQMHAASSHPAAPARNDPRLEAKSSSSQKSSRSRSKSPVRNSSSRSGKSGSSSHSSSSSRKRSESKSSTTSSSSSSSDVRHKGVTASSSNQPTVKRSGKITSKDSDRYVRNGSPLGSAKRKSSSPSSSPSKSKRSTSHKSSSSRGKTSSLRSRSRSPVFMDVDLRTGVRSKSPESRAVAPSSLPLAGASLPASAKAPKDLEKRTPAASLVRQSSPSPSSSSISSQGNVSDALQLSINKLLQVQGGAGEKRPADALPPHIDGEEQPPQQKRSKSAKLDALFGSEDVDLRREILVVKPGVIVVEDDSMDECDVDKPTKKSGSPPKKATLEELRAKLANSARIQNKQGKSDKSRDQAVSQRLKQLAELKVNDDSQEAHDEKVRTILSQAQEMYENNGMNQEQYKDLVQKVVAINENSKIKESRRRDNDLERNAARDAVLRKRIPKLKGNENHSAGSPHTDGSPRYDDQPAAAPEKPSNKRDKTKREMKRRKPTKWGEQVDAGAAQRTAWQLANVNNNNNNNNNKRGGIQLPVQPQAGFRGMPWQQPPAMVLGQSAVPPPPQPPSMISMPPVPPVTMTKAINSLDNPMADVVRSITIDGGSKEIRFYNQVAIIFMDGDQPHEIGFQPGQRVIFIDHNEPLPLCFNDDYKPFHLDGQLHRIRFGFPSRELYIDEHWYEIYFGGPAVSVPIGNKLHIIKAEGPPPNVDIGRVRRDLVVGKINMIADAHTIVPLFLDARQQTFQLGAEQHSLQFVDSFQYALLDGQLQKMEYGGLPKGMMLNGGRSCFIRFGTLPKGVIAGKTHVADMVYIKTDAPAEPPKPPPIIVKPPPVVEQPKPAPVAVAPISLPAAAAALESLNINDLFQKLVSSGIIGGATAAPTLPAADSSAAKEPTASATEPSTASATVAPATLPAGPPAEPIKRIDLRKPESIKTRQAAVVAVLYLGMQCSSCGVRFPPEQTIKYSQHLDWHFRQNRRERDSTRKATSRKWYYDLNDWRQYEEIEDVEEREKNFLEAQGQPGGVEALDELSQQRSLDSPVPTCAAGRDDVDHCCDMCHEKFEQFYNEELEEWHLRSAIRVEDKIYHPLCYEDYKASLNPPTEVKSDQDVDMNNTDDNAMDTLIKVEDDEDEGTPNSSQPIFEDDDDDVIVLPNEEPSVTEIVDDDDEDEYVPGNVTRADMGNESQDKTESNSETKEPKKDQVELGEQQQNESANESDVEIQEPNIPFTDLDTYVEKEMDEATRAALLNVKIKEEPKDEYEEDEDDGFEDVGTVVSLLPLPEDEISIHSSETQTHTIGSSASPATIERPASVTSLSLPANEADELEQGDANTDTDAELNGEKQEATHNLSAVGPALPLASIVNKIKINITKNTSSNSHNSASNTTTTDSQVSAISVIGGSGAAGGASGAGDPVQQVNAIQTISTIPVLCGGNTFVPKIATSTPSNVISSISVIGSTYGASSSSNGSRSTTSTASSAPAASLLAETGSLKSPTPPLATVDPDPEPVVEQKPALRNATLKRTKKVQNGIETSGLCSIM
uniref:Pre-mRNA cleavage complex 2 protein Pcf11 n=2 Tax=Drosophila melanogaster TaxID=7227 RepID=A0A0B4LFF9_DROME|nr:Pcf11 cleavage and polyadenylation factor subunit, isoform E [Drosophila melanogaster]NP_001286430.1 Pcf11 cleavage and polyadenylation factor subunit, isoform H [Drosophila melanogaster]ADV37177.1 Pcf11 cleavage and polyadenylation factor subunit, isoform E [Drosophila melanogaster]AHN56228.1 Pcf11 cleavage and polyadenylation factor subunit, isoform H [Drosophila melanogaster]|eukprot:NP_001188931.1 protein 1 of cleavage and polyadenylation factor 1, isoform E [Drosophila melanogaster]